MTDERGVTISIDQLIAFHHLTVFARAVADRPHVLCGSRYWVGELRSALAALDKLDAEREAARTPVVT